VEHRLGRSWWLLALRGLMTLVFGVLTLFWPGVTLEILALIFGAYMFVDGVFALIAMLSGRRHGHHWLGFLLEGVAGILVGVLTFLHPGLAIAAVVYLIAAWAIVTGVFQLVEAVVVGRYLEGVFWLILSGVVSIVLGILLFANPGAGAVALAWFLGAYAIVAGLLMISLGVQLRAWSRDTSGQAPPAGP
jgi:uncharacterized membrane protein HdeD (DUF308 family)